MHNNCIELEPVVFAGLLEILSNVDELGILDHFADFAEAVGEAFELEGHDFGYGDELGGFEGVGLLFAFFAVVLVDSFEIVGAEEAGDALHQTVGPLALLILLLILQYLNRNISQTLTTYIHSYDKEHSFASDPRKSETFGSARSFAHFFRDPSPTSLSPPPASPPPNTSGTHGSLPVFLV